MDILHFYGSNAWKERRGVGLIGKLVILYLIQKTVRIVVKWWRNVRYLRTQSHLVPISTELADTPWALIKSFGKNMERLSDFRTDLFKKYCGDFKSNIKSISGCGFLFGFEPFIITMDPNIIKYILNDNFNNYLKMKNGLEEFMGHNLLTANHGPHAKDKGEFYKFQRKTASYLFTERKLKGILLPALQYNLEKLVKKIQEHVILGSGDGFPMKKSISILGFDTICEVGFGYRNEKGEHDTSYQEAFDGLNRLMPNQVFSPFWKLPFSHKYIPSKIEITKYNSKLTEFFHDAIDAREAEDGESTSRRADLLSMFIVATKENKYTKKELRDLLFLFIIAGKDTTAAVTNWLIYHLCVQPELQERLFAETAEAIKFDRELGTLSIDSDKIKANMFLDGLVWETLRLHPSFPWNGKVAAQDDVLPNGMVIKKGTTVLYDGYAMARDPNIYPNPEKFIPSRWMDDGRKSEDLNEYAFPVFLGGKRLCIGKNMALRQIKVVVTTLIHRFRLTLHKTELDATEKRKTLYTEGTVHEYACDLLLDLTERTPACIA